MGFPKYQRPSWAPSDEAVAVTPSDTQNLPAGPGGSDFGCRGLYIGVGGDVKVDMALPNGGTGIVFKAVPTGTFMPICVSRVYNTGTTAASIVALY